METGGGCSQRAPNEGPMDRAVLHSKPFLLGRSCQCTSNPSKGEPRADLSDLSEISIKDLCPGPGPIRKIALTRGSWRALAKWRAALVAVCLHARMCPCVHAYHDITHMPGSSMLRPVLCWQFATAWSSQQLWGYRPHDAFKYIEALQQGSFSCFDGSAVLPADAVNDDFCDCADGSDEPGTPACAGVGLFYCRNAESIPKLIYSSHVADGICDCCDGSDEWSSSCPNTCSLDGPVLRAQQQLGIEAPHCCPGFPVS